MSKFGIDIGAVGKDTSLLIVSVDSSTFVSVEQRDKALIHVRKMKEFIDIPVIVIDRSTTSIQAFTDEQLAELGLQRIDNANQ